MSGKEMNFDVAELIAIIRKNRDKHAVAYKEAVQEYKIALEAKLRAKVEEVCASLTLEGTVPSGNVTLQAPRSFLEEYDQYLDMLGMTQDKTIALPMSMFNQLVRDKWQWKSDFDMLKLSYTSN